MTVLNAALSATKRAQDVNSDGPGPGARDSATLSVEAQERLRRLEARPIRRSAPRFLHKSRTFHRQASQAQSLSSRSVCVDARAPAVRVRGQFPKKHGR